MHWRALDCVKTSKTRAFCCVFAVFLQCFCYKMTVAMRSTMQVLQPQGLCINKPFYTSTAFTPALLLHKSVFRQDPLLHKSCFYTSAVFTQALLLPQALLLHKSVFTQDLLLHKRCLYTSAVFTQALLLHKAGFYTKTFLHKTSFHSNAVFTQALSLHKHCFYTSPAFTQWHFAHKSLLQPASRQQAGGPQNAEGCKYRFKHSFK